MAHAGYTMLRQPLSAEPMCLLPAQTQQGIRAHLTKRVGAPRVRLHLLAHEVAQLVALAATAQAGTRKASINEVVSALVSHVAARRAFACVAGQETQVVMTANMRQPSRSVFRAST